MIRILNCGLYRAIGSHDCGEGVVGVLDYKNSGPNVVDNGGGSRVTL